MPEVRYAFLTDTRQSSFELGLNGEKFRLGVEDQEFEIRGQARAPAWTLGSSHGQSAFKIVYWIVNNNLINRLEIQTGLSNAHWCVDELELGTR